MTPRFHLGDHGDRSILGRTTEIKITMMRDTDGTVCGGFELSGHLGSANCARRKSSSARMMKNCSAAVRPPMT